MKFNRMILIAGSLLALSLQAANNNWKGADGAALNDSENWSLKSVPTSVTGYFCRNSSSVDAYRAVLNDDLSVKNFYMFDDNYGSLHVTLDLQGHTLTFTAGKSESFYVGRNKSGMRLTVTNGIVKASNKVAIYAGHALAKYITFGENSQFTGYAQLLQCKNSEFNVVDGAIWTLGAYVDYCSNGYNLLNIKGEKTSVTLSSVYNLDNKNPYSGGLNIVKNNGKVVVSDGASLTVTNGFLIGANHATDSIGIITGPKTTCNCVGLLSIGAVYTTSSIGNCKQAGVRNWLYVDDGATLIQSGQNIKIGGHNTGSLTNGIFVGNNATLTGEYLQTCGNGSQLVSSNGTINIGKSLNFPYYDSYVSTGVKNQMIFQGESPDINITADTVTSFRDSIFTFHIPKNGYEKCPLEFSGNTSITLPSTVRIYMPSKKFIGKTAIIKQTNESASYYLNIGNLDTLASELPENCELELSDDKKTLYLKAKPFGTQLIIK